MIHKTRVWLALRWIMAVQHVEFDEDEVIVHCQHGAVIPAVRDAMRRLGLREVRAKPVLGHPTKHTVHGLLAPRTSIN